LYSNLTMAGYIKHLTFATRQKELKSCGRVIINFTFGPAECEYVPLSETQTLNGSWGYQFFFHDEDLPGGMDADDFANCNVQEAQPWWECAEETPEPEDCPTGPVSCFLDLDILEELDPGAYLGLLEFDEVCNSFCLKAYPASDFLPEATPDRHALDYEVFSPNEPLQSSMETYITHFPRPMAVIGGIRVSVAQSGTGPLGVNFTVNGVNLTINPIVIPEGTRTIEIASSGLNAAFQSGNPITNGAEVLAEVTGASYDQYGTNWEGLRLSFRGRFTS